ncbi:PocR ligand-binding domain-containing protein [uncultured Draconibacterium sp.]|uniref:PocR ligand-binding domain-containing protein n=1 Tax=uncultured Draconibacterium sp. TaxID=1573823 RepID=UPI0029C865C6|nr:PocR ligand-binding domain-containing protein [uncultured Draconibacterium sp.]
MAAKINILNLVDFEEVNKLLEGFNQSTGFVTAILDLQGNVLSKSGWRHICTHFHRVNLESSKNCTVSDTVLANEMGPVKKYHFYKCLNGLVDVAVPLIIKGEHIANLFSGQFFFEEPNRNYFKKQAKKFGFNEQEYLRALENVPIVSKEKVKIAMDFLLNMTQLISEITLQKLEQEQLNKALMKSEERFRAIVFSSADWVWEIDKDGKYISSSHKSIDFFEVPEEEIIGKTPFDFMPEDEAKRVASIFSEIAAKKQPIKDLENWKIGKNGELICVLTNGLPILNDEGKLVGYRGIDKNITERKLFEKELIKAKEKAEESDRLKSAFLANMSHEIRTPMNGILGFTNLLLNPDLNSEKRENFIKIVHKSGQRMLNTVNDIVEVSKIEAGIISVRNLKIDINKEVEEMVHFFKPEANKKGLNLMIDLLLPDNKRHIETDKDKLDSIISNLIKNAIKYTESGTVKVGCRLNHSFIELYVKDTGIGIPAHRQDAIFNRFEQADIADKMVFEGSGLGLAIAKSYVEMLGGKIWVESKEGIGSTFYITLPVKRHIADNASAEKENSSKYEKPKSLKRKLKILIADDDETSRKYLHLLVSNFGKEIMEAETGGKALELCQKYSDIDLILMDIKMPLMDGYEATHKIRKFNKDVVIIAQTAYALSGDMEKALESGCNDYISKPFEITKVENLLQKYFGKQIQNEQLIQ